MWKSPRATALSRAAFAAALLLSSPPVLAQGAGVLCGTVSEPSGGVMAGVSVTLKSAAGQEAATVSGKDGEYLFTNVQPGMYSLTFWLDGFKKAVRNGLLVSADRWFRADMQMQVAAPAEYVELPAASVAYDRPRATAATFTRDIFTATSGRAVPAGPCKVDK